MPAIVFAFFAQVQAERESWPLWIPVFLGTGVALYFGLGAEPPTWVGWVGGAGGVILTLWGRRGHLGIFLPGLALTFLAGGFTAAQMRTLALAAPVLTHMTGAIPVQGTVDMVEAMAETGGSRITLEDVVLPVGVPALRRVRLNLRPAYDAVQVGQRIDVQAALMPPPRPAMAGAYDFPRKAWFLQLGATGSALSNPVVLGPSAPETVPDASWRVRLNGLRQTIGQMIRQTLPGAEGGVAMAIMTGQTTHIPADVAAAYRASGLAHILVIAGLHMGLLSGLVFVLVRGGLALFPAIALTYPIKKWAALTALLVTGGYMAVAGFPVPATRAFIMAAAVLLAVMLDRQVLSLRLWALAAVVILLAEPEELVGPSFQMSFAAVAALIAAYDQLGPVLRHRLGQWDHWWGRAVRHGVRLALTSLVAGSATMIYGLYHFDRIAPWQVLANMLAVPLVGIAVMPFALLALLLMPLGLSGPPLAVMGQGIAVVTDIAFWSATLPGSQITLPPLPLAGLLLFTAGGLWLCLWRLRWRLWGLVPMALALVPLALDLKPDLLVDEYGLTWAVRTAEGSLMISGGDHLARESWSLRAGPEAVADWPKSGRTSPDGRLSCLPQMCTFTPPGHRVALLKSADALDQACHGFDVVISRVPVDQDCPDAKVVIERGDLQQYGAHAVWLKEDGRVNVQSVGDWQGLRPWVVPAHDAKSQ